MVGELCSIIRVILNSFLTSVCNFDMTDICCVLFLDGTFLSHGELFVTRRSSYWMVYFLRSLLKVVKFSNVPSLNVLHSSSDKTLRDRRSHLSCGFIQHEHFETFSQFTEKDSILFSEPLLHQTRSSISQVTSSMTQVNARNCVFCMRFLYWLNKSLRLLWTTLLMRRNGELKKLSHWYLTKTDLTFYAVVFQIWDLDTLRITLR